MKNGPLAGYEMDSMKVTLKDGSFHAVDSDALSFELAAKWVIKLLLKLQKQNHGANNEVEVLLQKKIWVILLEI